ncbi:MAG: hypothetical protein HRU40_12835 [Saprospiraceae bacterium]|nr:hypothetical protein [Saprospiraceae bacterium]
MRFIIPILFLVFHLHAVAQNTPVSWTFKMENTPSNTWKIVAEAEVEEGWYIYSQYLEEGGPVPTQLNLETSGVEPIGKAIEIGDPITGYDDLFGMDIVKFKYAVTFSQEVRMPKGWKSLSGEVYYMVCNDEQCLPPRGVPFSVPKI